MSLRLLVLFFTLAAEVATAQQAQLPVMELTAGMHRIEAEVAATQSARMTGLMKRKTMPAQRGMLFVFNELDRHCMWMRNTDLPLSVAFLDEKGRILNIEDMQPHTEVNHCATKPARFALEMNLGWFKARGVSPGFMISGMNNLTSGR